MPVIELKDVERRYGERVALAGVSVSVQEGETLTVLGPNGAGKTTLLKVLSTLLRPHGGSARVLGAELPGEAWKVRGRVGLLGHEPLLYRDLSARENLLYHARLHQVPLARVDEVLAAVGMEGRADEPVRELSRGMVQRVASARAVLHDPPLLLLDEPRAGLDATAAELLEPLVGKASGRTRVLVTHDAELGRAEADQGSGARGRAARVIRSASAILRKDLRLEARTKESVPAMLLFSVTAFVLFHFGLDRDSLDGELAGGVLWVTLLLASVIGVTRLFAAEREQGGIEGLLLSPADRTGLWLAKAAALFVYLTLVELVAIPAFTLLLLGPGLQPELLPVLLLANLGLAGVGALVSALASEGRARELVVPLMLLPLLAPLLIAASGATEPLFSGDGSPEDLGRWLALLSLYDLVFVLLSVAVFDYLLDD